MPEQPAQRHHGLLDGLPGHVGVGTAHGGVAGVPRGHERLHRPVVQGVGERVGVLVGLSQHGRHLGGERLRGGGEGEPDDGGGGPERGQQGGAGALDDEDGEVGPAAAGDGQPDGGARTCRGQGVQHLSRDGEHVGGVVGAPDDGAAQAPAVDEQRETVGQRGAAGEGGGEAAQHDGGLVLCVHAPPPVRRERLRDRAARLECIGSTAVRREPIVAVPPVLARPGHPHPAHPGG